jgi:hypothetical protein
VHESKAIPQGSVSHGQALSAVGILVFLGITVPLFGLMLIPVVALATLARALSDAAAESCLLKKVQASLAWARSMARRPDRRAHHVWGRRVRQARGDSVSFEVLR